MSILVTGGNRGLGRALVNVFSHAGHQVYTLIRNEAVAKKIEQAYPLVKTIVADVTRADQLTVLVWQIEAGLDVLINNAGMGSMGASIYDTQVDEVESQFRVHCLGAINVTQAALPMLNKARQPLIINIFSRLGSLSRNASGEFDGKGFSYAYRIAKCAQNMFILCLAQELGPRGFRVCAIHPGTIKTASGSADAHLTADEPAAGIYRLILAGELKNAGYYCVDSGRLSW